MDRRRHIMPRDLKYFASQTDSKRASVREYSKPHYREWKKNSKPTRYETDTVRRSSRDKATLDLLHAVMHY
jgi:hypothetical protein